jgi:hypothetical protein
MLLIPAMRESTTWLRFTEKIFNHELGASSATSQPACYRYSSQETDLCG